MCTNIYINIHVQVSHKINTLLFSIDMIIIVHLKQVCIMFVHRTLRVEKSIKHFTAACDLKNQW